MVKDYSEYGFREHGVMLYLDKTLYKAFIRLQADKELGRAYAGLLPFVEGLYRLGYLSEEDYRKYVQKYSQGLKEEPKPLTMEELERKEKLQKIERILKGAFEQWDLINENAKAHHIKTAMQYKELPISQEILRREGIIK